MRFVPSNDEIQAELFLIEPSFAKAMADGPTAEELQVHCLCRHNGTIEIGVLGDPKHFERLVQTYSPDVVFGVSKHVTLSR